MNIMDFADLQPITNQPALFIKKDNILIIADLHIGIEKQLQEFDLYLYYYYCNRSKSVNYYVRQPRSGLDCHPRKFPYLCVLWQADRCLPHTNVYTSMPEISIKCRF